MTSTTLFAHNHLGKCRCGS